MSQNGLKQTTPNGVTIYTSYHARAPKFALEDILHVSVSRGAPRWSAAGSYVNMLDFAPPAWLINKPAPEYIPIFQKQLSDLIRAKIMQRIEEIAKEKGVKAIALCCFEKPNAFCHRFLVAEWIEEVFEIQVKEWGCSDRESEGIRHMQKGFGL